MDIAFIGSTAYVLVTLVGPDVGGSDVVGIYRVDGPNSFTVIADIGAFALANPPRPTSSFRQESSTRWKPIVAGSWSPMDTTTACCTSHSMAQVSELIAFGNIVPTGLAISGNTIYMAEAGPVPHLPQNGKVVAFGPNSSSATRGRLGRSASRGRGVRSRSHAVRALAGLLRAGPREGSPAEPDTGSLVGVNSDGTFTDAVRAVGPADLARIDWQHRIRGHAHRGDLEDRRRRSASVRHIELSTG